MSEYQYIPVQKRGLITLPADLRRRHGLDEPGAQVAVSERADGVIELLPLAAIPVDQLWFWSERWQDMEREADADIAAGRIEVVENLDALLADLE